MDRLAHDVALVRSARDSGIETNVVLFRRPHLERTRLKVALADRGYELTT